MDLLKHLRYFAAVAEEEHIGRAAERLNLAQPALSQRVKALEAHVGVPLTQKTGRGIALTDAGRRLAARAASLVEASERLALDLTSASDGALVIAIPTTLTPARLHALADGLNRAMPPRTFRLLPMPPGDRAAGTSRTDAALVATPAAGEVSLPLGVAVPAGHPLAVMPSLHPSDLGESGLLILDEEAPARPVIEAQLDRHGLAPTDCVWDVPAAAALARGLAGDPCLTDPRHAIDAGLRWVPFVGPTLRRELSLRWSATPKPHDPGRLLAVIATALEGDVAPRAHRTPRRSTAVQARIRDVWGGVGIRGSLHARDLGTGAGLGIATEESWPIASVGKVPLAVALHRAADRGHVRLDHAVTLRPDGRSRGTTGISAMADPVRLSLRDALYLALTISDNAAADAVWDSLGADRVQRLLREVIPPEEVRLAETMRDLYDRIEFGGGVLDAPFANRATAAGLTHLLEQIWTDRAASSDGCAQIRDLMHRQVWSHRLASGFGAADIQIAGKTGTVGDYRHEIGVATYPDGGRYAVAVLTRRTQSEDHHRWDWAIGESARLAVGALRRGETNDL